MNFEIYEQMENTLVVRCATLESIEDLIGVEYIFFNRMELGEEILVEVEGRNYTVKRI